MKWFTPEKKSSHQGPSESLLRSLKRRSLRLKRPKHPQASQLLEKRKSDCVGRAFLYSLGNNLISEKALQTGVFETSPCMSMFGQVGSGTSSSVWERDGN
ncbi:unnamed protein product [Nesidiocoris tenuis]|uniref:Uncharacterized protein n=1 Tax=Nesidiocoris tenuis TaxID=355587 RepID=A0A6H5HG19_9HEMI|nr:unnamed protein product [Nesidiocoris tenuis]